MNFSPDWFTGLRTARDDAHAKVTGCAYAVAVANAGGSPVAAALPFWPPEGFTARNGAPTARPIILTVLQRRRQPFSASELQWYLYCPFLWFAASCLRVASVIGGIRRAGSRADFTRRAGTLLSRPAALSRPTGAPGRLLAGRVMAGGGDAIWKCAWRGTTLRESGEVFARHRMGKPVPDDAALPCQ